MSGFPHAEAFWAALGPTRLRNRPAIEARLEMQLAAARDRWPAVEIDGAAFAAHWAERLARTADPEAALEQLHVADLYLAFGCASGEVNALRAFTVQLAAAGGAVRGVDASPAFVDEVLQRLQTRVLVAEAGASPRILEYAGRGSLENWLRAGALRLALNARRDARRGPDPLPEVSQFEAAAPTGDLQFELMRGRYGADFGRALRQAFGELESQERNVLRLHFLEGLSLNQIGAMYQVNKSTISRRMARARETLLGRTRERLEAQLSIEPSELDSLLELLGPRLDLSLASVLNQST
jgi:RNA polymerase sigma-70 factor (ECF subfamily)